MDLLKRLCLIMMTFLLLLVTVPVAAQQGANPGSGLSISPPLSQFTLKPGEGDTLEINIKNITTDAVIATPVVNDFKSDNLTGNPQIITDPNRHSPNSINPFISNLQPFELAKGQQKKVTISVHAPADIPPGAYYGIVRFKAVPTAAANNSGNGQVALTASVGSIVLITVPGNIRDQIELKGIHIYAKNHSGSILTQKPDQYGIEVKNLGNGFAQPFGVVEVTDMFGKKVFTQQFNDSQPRSSVLPGSNRIFKEALKNISRPGRYTLTASLVYGADNSVLATKKTFWYIPLWLVLAVLVVIALLVLGAYRLYHLNRKDVKRASRRR